MARSASADSSERTSLLKEIAELELELARLSDPARGLHQHARAKEGRETDGKRLSGIAGAQVDEESDLILNRILDAASTGAGGFGRVAAGVEENAELTGIRIERASARVLSSGRTSQIRLHSLSGNVRAAPLSPIAFKLELRVREPPMDPDERYKAGRDPGREYVIEEMSSRIEGGSLELQDAFTSVQPDDPPNPPVFFALLRQYSLFAAHRVQLFTSLIEEFRNLAQSSVGSGQVSQTELTFSSKSARSPTLNFSYRIAGSSSPSPILRAAQPVEPHLSLAATTVPSSISAEARQALDAIPAQFERLLKDGCEAQAAVEAVVRAVFEGEA